MDQHIEHVKRETVTVVVTAIAISLLALSCSSSEAAAPAATCPSFAGSYSVTTEIVATNCPLGLHAITQPVTWTFVQSAPSCNFTMTNSLYAASQYTGYFSMEGSNARVTWTTVTPPPTVSGRALTYVSESLTIIPAVAPATGTGTISGSFAWSSAYPCTGTTNVCSGSIVSGCLTPN